ncbi:hypothetical protein [Deinococcus sp. SL84]|uniref:hypothetical protein n=1 Tax=Deinococcus sp. SL84 TaxID=2994663 RepID=UPI002273CA16|nr:hypothetical protein [Deinococcus sp. SL84]MCY1701570.1 hypothetical protein [Deinococcus sp. SL84]
MTRQPRTLTAHAVSLIACALLLLGPAAQHPGAGPVTDVLMWGTLLLGLLMLGLNRTGRIRRDTTP